MINALHPGSLIALPARFDDIEIGQVINLGAAAVEPQALEAFVAAF